MKFSILLSLLILVLSGCGNGKGERKEEATNAPAKEDIAHKHSAEGYNNEGYNHIKDDGANEENRIVPSENPEDNYLLAEQAVDAWLYFHLSDYKSYEPLIRSTDYDATRNLYIHHLRLRQMNPQGGMTTSDHTFEVDMTRTGENGTPFRVTEIP